MQVARKEGDVFTSARFFASALVLSAMLAPVPTAMGGAQPEVYVVDGVLERVWLPATTETVRVYQGSSWVWSPAQGWHRHDQWSYIRRVVPGHWEQRVRMLDVFSR